MSTSPSSRTRTLLLSVVVILAIIVVALIGMVVFRQEPATPTPERGQSTTVVTATSTTPEPTSTAPTRTTTQVKPGSVTYQLTGSGDVVGLAYRNDGGRVVVAATGTPWSNRTVLTDRNAEMTAMVVRGPVTCTILQGEKLISSSTSRGGPLRCAGKLPR